MEARGKGIVAEHPQHALALLCLAWCPLAAQHRDGCGTDMAWVGCSTSQGLCNCFWESPWLFPKQKCPKRQGHGYNSACLPSDTAAEWAGKVGEVKGPFNLNSDFRY